MSKQVLIVLHVRPETVFTISDWKVYTVTTAGFAYKIANLAIKAGYGVKLRMSDEYAIENNYPLIPGFRQ